MSSRQEDCIQDNTTVPIPQHGSQEEEEHQVQSYPQSQHLSASVESGPPVSPNLSPNNSQVSPSLSIRTRRKKRTSSGTFKEVPSEKSMTIQTQSKKGHLNQFNNSDSPITPSGPCDPSWKWNTGGTGLAILRSPATLEVLRSTSTNAVKHKSEHQKTTNKQHKRENSLLDWKDKERFEMLSARQIR